VAKQLQNIHPELKILFMPCYTADAIARQEILEENVNCIQKPFSLRAIAEKIPSNDQGYYENGLIECIKCSELLKYDQSRYDNVHLIDHGLVYVCQLCGYIPPSLPNIKPLLGSGFREIQSKPYRRVVCLEVFSC
jgi:hypothetical protein